MANTTTPILGLVKPEVNGAETENVWGFDLNANFDKIDTRIGELPQNDAPFDGDIYGRRQGSWSRTVLRTEYDALIARIEANEDADTEQDEAIANHTQPASTITDFAEATDDRVAALLTAGPNVLITYDDTLGKLTIASSGGGSGGGSLGDGDYGDITVTNGGLTWTIDPVAVTYAKIQNVTANKLLGAVTAGTVQEITCTAAGRALLDDADAAAQRVTLGVDLTQIQPLDPTLTALAGLTGVGLVEQTDVDVFAKRAIGVAAATDVPTRADGDARWQTKDPTLGALSFLDGTAGLIEETGLDVFVKRAIGVGAATSIPTRADADARYAQFNSPQFTGDARAVTASFGDNDTSIATTAFVQSAIVGSTYDKTTADTRFVNATGDSMTGDLTNSGRINITNATQSPALGNGALIVAGGVCVYGNSTFGGSLQAANFNVTGGAYPTNGLAAVATGAPGIVSGGLPIFFVSSDNNVGRAGAFTGEFRNGSNGLSMRASSDSGLTSFLDFSNNSLNQCGGVLVDAALLTTQYTTSSDVRGKANRAKIAPLDAQAIIDALEVYDFDKDGNQIRGYGVIAQQAYAVHKSLAFKPENEDDWWQVEKAAPVPFLIANMQLLNQMLKVQADKIAELEARLIEKEG